MKPIKTAEEYRQRLQELKKTIQRVGDLFLNDTPEIKAERIAKAKSDFFFFARTYFSHYIEAAYADFQKEEITDVINILKEKRSKIKGEFWFRGSGKTTNFGVALPIWLMIDNMVDFYIFVGKDQKIITERTLAVRAELMYNKALLHDFPDFAMTDSKGEIMAQGEEADFESPMGDRFLALGYKMAIRGRIHGCKRPRYILIDDFENHMDTNPEIAQEKVSYVFGEAFGAFGKEGGVIIWLGNLTHSQSAANRFVERCKQEPDNPELSFRLVPGIDEYGVPTWKAAFTQAMIESRRRAMGQVEFNRHFLMKPMIEGKVFKEDWLKFYNPYSVSALKELKQNNRLKAEQAAKLPNLDDMPGIEELRNSLTVTYCDPSLGNSESNDYKGIETVAFCRGQYFVLDRCLRHMTINEMFEYMYRLDLRFKTKFFMEDNFWQVLLFQFLPAIAEKKGYLLPIKGVTNRLSKVERILSLQPLYEMGFIWDCTLGKDFNEFKEQLLGFPNANNDDGPDALSGAIARFAELACETKYERVESRSGSFEQML